VSGAPAAVHVVCLGNPWHGDDGFGRHVFRLLRMRDDLPPAVALFDAGIAGLDVLPLLDGCGKAVIVDAVRVGAPVGTLHRLAPSDLAPPGGEFSLHELGLSGLLAALPALSTQPPDVVVIGAQVGRVRSFSEGLSPPLRHVLPAAVALVVRECSPTGVRRDGPPGRGRARAGTRAARARPAGRTSRGSPRGPCPP
jgi:hydrogenase maturation protease